MISEGGLVEDESFWRNMSELYSRNEVGISMNIDLGKIKPKSEISKLSRINLKSNSDRLYTDLADQRKMIGGILGVGSERLALTKGSRVSMIFALSSIKWNSGDHIVLSDQEHPGTLAALDFMERMYGVCLYQVKIPINHYVTESELVNVFDNAISNLKRAGKIVRALIWSSPTYRTGLMIPVKKLSQIARDNSLISICDGAHLLGMVDFDYSNSGVDFLCGSGHKWQAAPHATGFLVLSERIVNGDIDLNRYVPLEVPGITDEKSVEFSPGSIATRLSACSGSRVSQFEELAESCQVWKDIGQEKIQAYIFSLGSYLKEKISTRWGVDRLFTPHVGESGLSSGICAFNPFEDSMDLYDQLKSNTLVRRLAQERGVNLRNVDIASSSQVKTLWPLRINTPVWLDSGDIDVALDHIWNLSRKGIS